MRGWFGRRRMVQPRPDVVNPILDGAPCIERDLKTHVRPPFLDLVEEDKRAMKYGEFDPYLKGYSEETIKHRRFWVDNLRYEQGGRKLTRATSCPPDQCVVGHLGVDDDFIASPPRATRRSNFECSAHHCHSPSVRDVLQPFTREDVLIQRDRRKEVDVAFAKYIAEGERCSIAAKEVGKSTAECVHHLQSSGMASALSWAN